MTEPPSRLPSEDAELRRRLPRALVRLAHASPRVRDLALRAAFHLEGGWYWSATARDVLRACCDVEVGAYSYGECFVPGAFAPGTVIGRYVSIAEGVRGLGRNHPMDRLSTHPFFFNRALGFVESDAAPHGPLEIGADAWLGLRAILTPGCRRVGVGAVVAAGSVVTRDVEDFAVVAGSPARLVRHRFPEEMREVVLASRWWERPVAECVRHIERMGAPLADAAAQHPLLAPQGAVPERARLEAVAP
jgi:virginiamycin A acetyltransferase